MKVGCYNFGMKRLAAALLIGLLVACIAASAQELKATDDSTKPLPEFIPPRIPKPLPFKPGETLTYQASFSKFIFSGTIGDLTLSVSQTPELREKNLLELRADAVSKGFFPSLLGLKVKDTFLSSVSADDLGVEVSARHVEENKIRRDYRSTFNRSKGVVTFTAIDRTKGKADPKTKDRVCPTWVQDVLSALYFIRTQPLKDGDVVPIPLSDLGENYNVEGAVLKHEQIKVAAGTFKAIRLDARIFDGRFTKRSGELHIWISDDDRRLPLLAKLKTSGYSAVVELTSFKTEPNTQLTHN
jgi:hypothetical protein